MSRKRRGKGTRTEKYKKNTVGLSPRPVVTLDRQKNKKNTRQKGTVNSKGKTIIPLTPIKYKRNSTERNR